jgi:uncharacterized membrane protein
MWAWIFDAARLLHILAGFAALFIFWIPLVTRKGGKAHVTIGWIYVAAMSMVALSALTMAVWRIADPGSSWEIVAFSWFLLYIALLSSAAAWYGIRVLRFKNRKGRHQNAVDLAIPALLVASGTAISVYGFLTDFPLLAWFPLVGLFLGTIQLIYWLKPPRQKMHWWFEHFIGMLSCCIATITAFTVFGAPRLLNVDTVSPLLWFVPTIVIVPVMIGFSVYYAKKFHVRH